MMRIGLVTAALAAGCLPTPAPARYDYVVLAPSERKAPDPTVATVGLTRVTVPRYLDRDELATRAGNRLEFSARERWAEPLADSVPRVLADNLEANGIGVPSARADFALVVDIERFERDGKGSVELEARWTLRDADRDQVVRSGRSRVEERTAGAGGEATARALSTALGRLGAELAVAVREARRSAR